MDTINIISEVNGFYWSAWTMLIAAASGLLALIGFIWPLLLRAHQKKMVKLETEQGLESVKRELRDEFDREMKKIKKKVSREFMAMQGMGFHLQANARIRDGRFKGAATDLMKAQCLYLKGKDNLHFSIVTRLFMEKCLDKLTPTDMEEILLKNNWNWEEHITSLRKIDTKNKATHLINSLNHKVIQFLNS